MHIRVIILAVGIALIGLALAGVAQADILASGPVYGGGNGGVGGHVTCRIFNAGLTSVVINVTQIWTNTGVSVAPTSNTCIAPPNAALAPTKYCAFTAPIAGNFAFSCRINVQGIDTNVKGIAEITGSANQILNALPMEK